MAMRTVAVTGGGSGIGEAICRRFQRANARVLVCDVDEGQATRVADEIGGLAIVGDVGTSWASVAGAIRCEVDGLDALVHSAAIHRKVPLRDASEAELDDVYMVNLRAPVLLSAALLSELAAVRGTVVSIASMSGVHPQPGAGLYTPMKSALIAWTRQASVEWGPLGVRVNAVAPGLVRTPMSEATYADPVKNAGRTAMVPLGRIAEPDDVAGVACFLASPEAAYINGTCILVDGGVCNMLMALMPS